jgi:hypothetical protein
MQLLAVKKKETPAIPYAGEHITLVVDKERGQTRIARVESGYRFAFELRNAARVMANNARAIDKDSFELRAFVTGAVILAWSSLDAALNEFILINAIEPKSPLTETEKATINAIRFGRFTTSATATHTRIIVLSGDPKVSFRATDIEVDNRRNYEVKSKNPLKKSTV